MALMITGHFAATLIQNGPSKLTSAPNLATSRRDGRLVGSVKIPPPELDRITLTLAASLDLLIAGAEVRLRDMDATLDKISGPAQDPALIGMHVMTRLMPIVLAAGTAMDKAMASAVVAIATEKSLPGQAKWVA